MLEIKTDLDGVHLESAWVRIEHGLEIHVLARADLLNHNARDIAQSLARQDQEMLLRDLFRLSGSPIMLYDNPDLYDAILPVTAGHSNFYTALARRHAGPVLALACGSGQLIVPIAGTGLPAMGIDISPNMLMAARRRASDAGLQVELQEGDMRKFDIGRQFQVIFVARNSLLHLSERDDFAAFFSSVRRHLLPDGVLAFDIFNPDVRILARPNGERMHVMRVESSLHGEIDVDSTSDYDSCSQVNRATWFISTAAKRDAWVAPLHLRSIFPQELLALLAANGFTLVRRDGDFAGGSFTNGSSRQVCQCRPV